MKEYVLSVAGAVLLSAVAALVLPKGKIAGSIRFVLKLICLLALVSPFFTLFSKTDPPELSSGDGYFAACASLAERSEEERVARYLLEEYGVTASAEAECEGKSPFLVKTLCVTVSDFGINEAEEHIHIIARIREALGEEYDCEVTVREAA